jgi:hypothetical protein
MFGHTNTSGIPAVRPSADQLKEMHLLAQKNDGEAKERMKQEYDTRMRAREGSIGIGSIVLVKQERKNKLMPAWDPNPYTVTLINGSLITAKRTYPTHHEITRNSSFFKRYIYYDDENSNEIPAPTPGEIKTGPVAESSDPVKEGYINTSTSTTESSGTTGPEISLAQAAESSDPSTIELQATESSDQSTGNNDTTKRGRPTKEQSILNEQKYREEQAAKRAANPPQRASTRLKINRSFI